MYFVSILTYLPSQLAVVLMLSLLCLTSCVTPPRDIRPAVIDEQEIDVVTHIETARGYRSRGRLDFAEMHLRLALEVAKQADAGLYNDLGVVLAGQDRLGEAITFYQKASALEPENVSILQNLARTLYKGGRYVESRQVLEQILQLHFEERLRTRGASQARALTLAELVAVYRDYATTLWMIGHEDEASCYSTLAAFLEPSLSQIGQHSRTLLASERHQQAITAVEQRIREDRERASPAMMFDYALALASVGNVGTSEQALGKLLSLPNVSGRERREAKTFLAVISEMTGRSANASLVVEEVYSENPDLCERLDGDEPSFWPTALVVQRRKLLEKECANGAKQRGEYQS